MLPIFPNGHSFLTPVEYMWNHICSQESAYVSKVSLAPSGEKEAPSACKATPLSIDTRGGVGSMVLLNTLADLVPFFVFFFIVCFYLSLGAS